MIRLNAPRLLKRLRPYRAAGGEIRGKVSASVRAEGGAPAPLEIECPRESDVLDALASSRWPHRVDAELSNHVASCAICRDVITVASRRGRVSLYARADDGTPRGAVFIPFAFYEAAANLLTNSKLDPFGKIPEFKYCAIRVSVGGLPPLQGSYGGGQVLEKITGQSKW